MILSKSKCSLFASLAQSKMRRRHSLFIAEGRKAVADLMRSFRTEAVVVSCTAAQDVSFDGVPVYEATEADIKRISNLTTPPDIIGVFRMPETMDGILKINSGKLYLMLDGVQDPGNLGTIIRTCHWFGVFDILASRDTVDCYNPKTVQATMGSLGSVRVTYCDLVSVFDSFPDMPVYGLLLDGNDIFNAQLSDNGFIVMGNEGNGISLPVREKVTSPLLIPPAAPDHGESLNVAIATAVTLAQFRR